jgi:hypothetical protein
VELYIPPQPEADGRAEDFQATQAALVRSRPVLTAALRDPRAAWSALVTRAGDPIEAREQAVKVEFLESGEVMRISVEGDNPADLKTVVASVVDALRGGVRRVTAHEELKPDVAAVTDAYLDEAAYKQTRRRHPERALDFGRRCLADLRKEIDLARRRARDAGINLEDRWNGPAEVPKADIDAPVEQVREPGFPRWLGRFGMAFAPFPWKPQRF